MPAEQSIEAVTELCEKAVSQASALATLLEQISARREQPDFALRSEQLLEISSAIDKLNKKRIPVPDDLRRLKTDLLAQTQDDQKLTDALANISKILSAALVMANTSNDGTGKVRKARDKSLPTTPFKVLRTQLLKTLQELGGSGSAKEVLKAMETKFQTSLLPGDLKYDTQGVVTWTKNVRMVRHHLGKEGIMRSDGPRGVWQLAKTSH